MLSQSCLLVVGALAVLSSLIWLASRLESGWRDGYLPRAAIEREADMEEFEGLEPIVRSLCILAASVHAEPGNKDSPQRQQDIAECYFAWCMEGEMAVVLDDALINTVSKTFKLDPGRIRRDEPKRG
jgi:hypothetical protein